LFCLEGMLKTFTCLFLVACVAAGCGGDDPSSPSPVGEFPGMVGTWDGTLTVSGAVGGSPVSNTCRETWTISSQSAANFVGTFQTSGGTPNPCSQSGSLNGTVAAGGGVTDVVHGSLINPNTCTRVSRTPMAGAVNGAALSAQSNETLSCSGTTVTRTLSVSLTKR